VDSANGIEVEKMLEFLKDLSLWYNLIFTVPIVLVIFYLILQIFGLAVDIGGSAGTDAGDADFDIDADADADVDVDADVDAGIDDVAFFDRAMSFVNVGKVPLTIIIATFLLFWGVTGYTTNGVIRKAMNGSFPSFFIIISCFAALVIGIIATKFLSGVIARIIPEIETYSSNNEALLGLVAQVVSAQVTTTFGRAKVKDQHGNFLTVFCKTQDGKEVPKRGDEVVLIDYDPSDKKFEVVKADFSEIT
jgi:hypothetical protein